MARDVFNMVSQETVHDAYTHGYEHASSGYSHIEDALSDYADSVQEEQNLTDEEAESQAIHDVWMNGERYSEDVVGRGFSQFTAQIAYDELSHSERESVNMAWESGAMHAVLGRPRDPSEVNHV